MSPLPFDPSNLDPEVIQEEIRKTEEELLRMRLARIRLKHFTEYTLPGYRSARHQDFIMEKLEQVEKYVQTAGKEGIGRLIISVPPRHGKSEMASIRFPAWFLGRNPNRRVMITSYGAALSEYFSRQVRTLIESQEYQKVFGSLALRQLVPEQVNVDPEGRSVQSWDIQGKRGGLVAAGVGGAITGRGADVLIIDDPIKDAEEADSEVIRQKVIDWYTSTAYTRLQKGGAVIVMMTRWHEADLAGYLQDKEKEKWTVIKLPAFAEFNDALKRPEGEPLWPDEYGVAELSDRKDTMPPRHWNALYQQNPTGEQGDVFNQNWFVYGDFPDAHDISYGFQVWDCAMTEKTSGDYSACVTGYVTRHGVFIADVYRARLDFPNLKRMMFEKYSQWNRVSRIGRIYIENKVAGISVIQSLKKDSHLPVIPLEPESKLGKSKLQRAQSVSGYVQAGRVIFKKSALWLHDFESELLKFPHGKHDDMVDAFVYALIVANGGGVKPKGSLTESRNRWSGMGLGMTRHQKLMGGSSW